MTFDGITLDAPVAAVQLTARGARRRARFAGYLALLLNDMLAITFGFWAGAMLRGSDWLSPGGINLGMATAVIYFVVALNQSAFSITALTSASESIRRTLSSIVTAALIIILVSFLLEAGEMIGRGAFIISVLVSAFAIGIGRALTNLYYISQLHGRLTDILVIVDGGPVPNCHASCQMVDAAEAGLQPDLSDPRALDRLAQQIRHFDRVIVSCSPDRRQSWSVAMKGTHVIGEVMMPETDSLGGVGIDEFSGVDTIVVSRGPLSLINRVKKRLFDLAISVPALVFLSPLLALVAIAIKIESKGPVLFRQMRVGQSNGMFEILKFRSMLMDRTDASGARSAQRDDDRITRVGRIIRATSIDELPQLLNVVRGDMSIVGPRPHALGSLAGKELFWEVDKQYWMRHALKPGITGLAQIRGQRGATHRREDLEERLRSDLEYLNGWRLSRDIAIVLGTVKVIVHRNAY